MMPGRTVISPAAFRAGVFDLDGVVTDTASAHFVAWKELFDDFLEARTDDQPEFTAADYRDYVDGKPRLDGIDSFLRSRNIELPDRESTIGRLAERKNELFQRHVRAEGVDVFDDAVDFIRAVRRAGISTAVVSSSKNCQWILNTAGLEDLFEARVDGTELDDLRGKPAPDMFVEAARRLGARPAEAFMVEDALAGVEAGRAGQFRLVVGIARGTDAEALREHGADVVIDDFNEMEVEQ